jgi:glycosyltransferase involved in cell wall biosynthesis
MTSRSPLSICFVAPEAYRALVDASGGHIGGAEVQQAFLAKALALRGHEVSFVVGDYGQAETEELSGIRLYRSYAPGRGNRVIRYPADSVAVFRAMRRAGSRVYLQRCVFHQTGRTWAFARLLGARFVFSAGDENNVAPTRALGHVPLPYRLSYRYAIKHADLILCQHGEQARGFLDNYGRHANILPNIIEPPCEIHPRSARHAFAWVGSLSARKRPAMFLDLAESLPDVQFVMIAKPMDAGIGEAVRTRAAKMRNLSYEEVLSRADVMRILSESVALVSTSSSEGFPNTFLEAMRAGTPVISYDIDPGDVIARSRAGSVVPSDSGAGVAAVRALLSDDRLFAALSEAAVSYVRANHVEDIVIPRLERYLAEVDERAHR